VVLTVVYVIGAEHGETATPDEHTQAPEMIELPAPTVSPMVVALGVTLAFAGLVTHAAVSFVGIALALIGGVGWWRESFPRNGWSRSPCARSSCARRRSCHRARRSERSSIGEGGHRIRVPVEVQP